MNKIRLTKEEEKGLKNTFRNFGKEKSDKQVFYDLCFCICAPQTTFKNNYKVVRDLQLYNFYKRKISKNLLEKIAKPSRFYRNKSRYLQEAKKKFKKIQLILKDYEMPSREKRSWLVKNVKGIGMKAASHLLRNLGDDQLAIIDTHILKFLNRSLPQNAGEYLKIESEFCTLAKKNKMTPAELDALIWQRYSKTRWERFTY